MVDSIRRVPGTGMDDKQQRWFCDLYNQWGAFLSPGTQNWIDFTFVKITVEYSPYKGSCEIEAWLLGVGLCVTYLYDRTFNDEMDRRVEEMLADPKKLDDAIDELTRKE